MCELVEALATLKHSFEVMNDECIMQTNTLWERDILKRNGKVLNI